MGEGEPDRDDIHFDYNKVGGREWHSALLVYYFIKYNFKM